MNETRDVPVQGLHEDTVHHASAPDECIPHEVTCSRPRRARPDTVLTTLYQPAAGTVSTSPGPPQERCGTLCSSNPCTAWARAREDYIGMGPPPARTEAYAYRGISLMRNRLPP